MSALQSNSKPRLKNYQRHKSLPSQPTEADSGCTVNIPFSAPPSPSAISNGSIQTIPNTDSTMKKLKANLQYHLGYFSRFLPFTSTSKEIAKTEIACEAQIALNVSADPRKVHIFE